MSGILFKLILGAFLFMLPTISAHEVRPSYLHIKQIQSSSPESTNREIFSVTWKQPITNDKRLKLAPQFPEQCNDQSKQKRQEYKSISSNAIVQHWTISCSSNAFEKQPILILGLSSTLTDVLLVAEFIDNKTVTRLIRPSSPKTWLNYRSNKLISDYFKIGFFHFLSGFDHLLFIFVLTILIRKFNTLLKTITAFTIAHSLTLAASVVNWVDLPQAPIEASIALSLLYLAYLASSPRGVSSKGSSSPWISAFIFGLLHGFGFSSALTSLGLPDGNVLSALLLFNLGIELAQVLLISLIILATMMISKLRFEFPLWLKKAPIYTIGTLSCYWFLQRSMLLLSS